MLQIQQRHNNFFCLPNPPPPFLAILPYRSDERWGTWASRSGWTPGTWWGTPPGTHRPPDKRNMLTHGTWWGTPPETHHPPGERNMCTYTIYMYSTVNTPYSLLKNYSWKGMCICRIELTFLVKENQIFQFAQKQNLSIHCYNTAKNNNAILYTV